MKISIEPFFLNIFSTDKNLSFVGWLERSETQQVSELKELSAISRQLSDSNQLISFKSKE
ncbi:hypothetical protein [Pseudoalteromonas shioyasakiensis]|uniref:hypothetical protein n=1 Tax=Pseudoalteromonas shioyasakiensis TaxID=1190813 RepID=UPI001583E85D|nr:hypothetical protein [Pseudoalteromonas shioyasakiensis]MDI4685846.1 hypothetical protein [Pseudoalteromonas shioyasakiensis]NUJ29337.1 hypothetical protein [Pseudoalteromonas sp. 2103]NUJ65755.1 hypothetical protein [Pseudoalteromonas sp. 2102]